MDNRLIIGLLLLVNAMGLSCAYIDETEIRGEFSSSFSSREMFSVPSKSIHLPNINCKTRKIDSNISGIVVIVSNIFSKLSRNGLLAALAIDVLPLLWCFVFLYICSV